MSHQGRIAGRTGVGRIQVSRRRWPISGVSCVSNFVALYPLVKYDPTVIPPTRQWLIEDLWLLGGVNGIAAPVKSGKSRLLCWLIVGLFKGQVLGLPVQDPRPPKVLYLAAEESLDEELHPRFTKYAKEQGLDPAVLDITVQQAMGMKLNLESHRKELGKIIKNGGFTVVVIDPMIRVHAADESKNSEMTQVLTGLRVYAASLGVTVIFLQHTPKPNIDTDLSHMENWFRGAGDFAAVVDSACYLTRHRTRDGAIHLSVLRQGRFAELPPLDLVDLGRRNDDRGFVNAN